MKDHLKLIVGFKATARPAQHVVYLALLCLSITGPLGEVHAQSCERPTEENMQLIDEDVSLTEFPTGSQATFECATGYTGQGSGIITCNAGSWSTVERKCTKYNCRSVGDLLNGEVDLSGGTLFGAQAVFSCNDGFLLVGLKVLTCGSSGWMGRPPTCQVTKCTPPPQVENADGPHPSKDLHDYLSVVRYTCAKDYTMNGSSSLHCGTNGSFIPSPPMCIMVKCPPPNIPHAEWMSGARPPYKYMNSVEYECLPGFTMQGSGHLICQLNSTWEPEIKCIANPITTTTTTTTPTTTTPTTTSTTTTSTTTTSTTTTTTTSTTTKDASSSSSCLKPTEGNNMKLSGDDDLLKEFPPGSTVTFECKEGYKPEGSGLIACNDGAWSDLKLTCSSAQKWWQSWWFILLCVIIVICIVCVIIWKRRGSRRKALPLGDTDVL